MKIVPHWTSSSDPIAQLSQITILEMHKGIDYVLKFLEKNSIKILFFLLK
jgi:hypothetical protein